MKFLVAFALLVATAAALPVSQDEKNAVVVQQELDNIGVEGYKFGYETSNGLAAQEEGQLKNVGQENEALVIRGQYSYTGPDGVVYTVTYVADENGFQPQGAHISQVA